MAKYKVNSEDLTNVAQAIRAKTGSSGAIEFPDGFVNEIGSIPSGGSTLITKSITANGTYNASSDNADGYSAVTVDVPTSSTPLEKVGTYTVSESWESGQTGLSVCQTVLDGYLSASAIEYLLIFRNNTSTSSYRVDAIICVSNAVQASGLSSAVGVLWRNYYQNISNGLGGSVRASQRTVIDIYRALHA